MSPPSNPWPTRRRLLGTVLGVGTVGLAGCLSQRETDVRSSDEPSGTDSTPLPDPSPSPTRSRSPERSDGRHDLWISNRTGTEHAIGITVAREGTDGTVLEGCYESPDGLAIRFPDVGEEGVTYDVRATIVGGDSLEDQWLPGACPEEYTGLFGTDGGVIIDDGLSFTQNECDYATVGHELPEISPGDVESCPEPTPTRSPQSDTTISPSRTSTG